VHWALPERRLKGAAEARRAADEQLEEFAVHFAANGKQYDLQLKRNRGLIAAGAKHTLIRKDGSREEGPMPQACFYQGSVANDPSGRVGLSTCKGGFDGLILAHGNIISISRVPQEEGKKSLHNGGSVQKHIVRRLTDSQVLEYQSDVQKFMRAHPNRTQDKNRRLATSGTKYVEAFVVNDYSRYQSFGGSSGLTDLAEQSVSVMNAVTTIYKTDPTGDASFPYVIQVVFVGQQTFVETDPWDSTVTMSGSETDCSSLLDHFHTWGQAQLSAGLATVSTYDNRILLSGRDFDGNTVGLAGVSTMCWAASSGNVNMCLATDDVAGCAATVAHEMGHNFGMLHDSSGNDCPSSGLIMEAVGSGTASTQFSYCSASYITTYFDSTYSVRGECLENVPTRVEGDPICGNGFVESGEDCDCGSSDCSSLDSCCDGSTCKLADESYECSSGGPCCESCMYLTASAEKVCRDATNTCDMAEYCPGGTDECPADRYVYPGAACTIGGFDGLCSNGACSSQDYLCSVEVNRDYDGNWDQSDTCASYVDSCQYVICHDADQPDKEYECGQNFAVHGKQMEVPEGTPCWFPSTQFGTRTGMCKEGSCVLADMLAVVPDCGNGGIDYGEECDCGTATEDTCCDCSTCMLKDGKQCSSQEECCDDTCQFKASGTECRAAESSCDVAETCTGSSGVCPSDIGQQWGTACTATDGGSSTCYGKICVDSLDMQCESKYGSGYTAYGDSTNTYHLCAGVACCLGSSCTRDTLNATFTDADGNSNTIVTGGASDGTILSDTTKICVSGIGTTPKASCSDGYFLSVAVGRCVACSSGCTACSGPTAFDCEGDCKYGQDTRGACAISEDQVTYAAITGSSGAATTTQPKDEGSGDTTTIDFSEGQPGATTTPIEETTTTKTMTITTTSTTTPAPEQVEFSSTINNLDFEQLESNTAVKEALLLILLEIFMEQFGLPSSCFEILLSAGSVQVDTTITWPTEEEQEALNITDVPESSSVVNSLTDATAVESLQTSLVQSISAIENIDQVSTGEITVSDFAVATTTTTTTTTAGSGAGTAASKAATLHLPTVPVSSAATLLAMLLLYRCA